MLTIMLGDFGTGKTSTAQWLAHKSDGIYLDAETIGRHNGLFSYAQFLREAACTMRLDREYYLDGVFGSQQDAPELARELSTPVNYVVCIAPPSVVQARQATKAPHVTTALPKSATDIINSTFQSAAIGLSCPEPMFADTHAWPPTLWTRDTWLRRWQALMLWDELHAKRPYQDLELGLGLDITGYTQSYRTWERLRHLDFTGRSVLDLGCHTGYFCFKAEQAGASSVVGVDNNPHAVQLAQRLAVMNCSRAEFMQLDLAHDTLPKATVVLALNILHHLRYSANLVDQIFQAPTVVLEMPLRDIPKLRQPSHPIILNSHRAGRAIVIYSRPLPLVLPKRYRYSYRMERAKTLWRTRVIGAASVIKRKLWRKHG